MAERLGLPPPATIQNAYSLLCRNFEEQLAEARRGQPIGDAWQLVTEVRVSTDGHARNGKLSSCGLSALIYLAILGEAS